MLLIVLQMYQNYSADGCIPKTEKSLFSKYFFIRQTRLYTAAQGKRIGIFEFITHWNPARDDRNFYS